MKTTRVLLIQPLHTGDSETFIRAHVESLPADFVLHGYPPCVDHRAVVNPRSLEGLSYLAVQLLSGARARLGFQRGDLGKWIATCGYLRSLREFRPDVVLAEYGTMGVLVHEACRIIGTPLVVYFHGFDATRREVLDRLAPAYRELFRDAAGFVASSRFIRSRLIGLGAPADRVHVNPCGVDHKRFAGGNPAAADSALLAVGRFVEKKAPQNTLTAFAMALRECPEARLRMIGDGPSLASCRELAAALHIDDAVAFLGAQPHEVVEREMRAARAFVQHSVVARDGDCEGTPVALLEAGATGIPVLTTRHASIPDAVIHGETGLLVDEHDVAGMARYMSALCRDPDLAARLGAAAQLRVRESFSMEDSTMRLREILRRAAERGPA